MGKTNSSKFKSVAKKIAKVEKKVSKAAVPLAYAAKYNKEIYEAGKFARKQLQKDGGSGVAKAIAKGAKYVANNADKIPWEQLGSAGKEALKDPRVQKLILEKSLGLGLKYGEKALDKKFGDKKGYRIAKGGVNLLYNLGTGNVGGAVNEASNIYGEADPNKKRVAKVQGYTKNISKMVNSAMAGDYQGAYEGAMGTYAMADPNKKRVAKVQKYSNKALNTINAANQMYESLQRGDIAGAAAGGLAAYSELDPNKKRVGKIGNYASGAIDLYNAGADMYGVGTQAYNVSDRSKVADAQAQIKNKKVNSALAAGSNIGQHKANLITAHENEDYGAMAEHAKMLHQEAKKANKMQVQAQASSSYYPIGGGAVKPMKQNQGILPMEGQGKYMNKGPSAPIGGSSVKPIAPVQVNPIGGGSKKPV